MEQSEFGNLALAELDAVYRLAYHLAQRPDEVDDLVQETYLRAFKFVGSYRPTDHGIRPWLFKILHNVLNTRLSQDQRRRELTDGLRHEAAVAPVDGDPHAAELATINWDGIDERLKAAIAELSLAHRTTFLLCAVEGLGYREIADVTEVPVGTVMSRLYRARARSCRPAWRKSPPSAG